MTETMTSADGPPWAARVADAAAAAIPNARRLAMEGQHHGVDQPVLAPVLAEFFTDSKEEI